MAKVLVSIDDRLLRRIDAACQRKGISRSAYLAQLADRDLGREVGPGADPSVQAALREIEALFATAPGGAESTELIRRMRDG